MHALNHGMLLQTIAPVLSIFWKVQDRIEALTVAFISALMRRLGLKRALLSLIVIAEYMISFN